MLCADNILLIAPSITILERLLHICEDELGIGIVAYIDMVINCEKSCCVLIGPRCDVSCTTVLSKQGNRILR